MPLLPSHVTFPSHSAEHRKNHELGWKSCDIMRQLEDKRVLYIICKLEISDRIMIVIAQDKKLCFVAWQVFSKNKYPAEARW